VKKRIPTQSRRRTRTIRSNSVRILKHQKSREADAALEIMQVYEPLVNVMGWPIQQTIKPPLCACQEFVRGDDRHALRAARWSMMRQDGQWEMNSA
jgi:hypothetical protein